MSKKFVTVRVVRQWHRLSREAVDAPSLDVPQSRIDGPGQLGLLSLAGTLELSGN